MEIDQPFKRNFEDEVFIGMSQKYIRNRVFETVADLFLIYEKYKGHSSALLTTI